MLLSGLTRENVKETIEKDTLSKSVKIKKLSLHELILRWLGKADLSLLIVHYVQWTYMLYTYEGWSCRGKLGHAWISVNPL